MRGNRLVQENMDAGDATGNMNVQKRLRCIKGDLRNIQNDHHPCEREESKLEPSKTPVIADAKARQPFAY